MKHLLSTGKRLLIILLLVVVSTFPSVRAFADDSVISACPEGMSKADCEALYGNWVNWLADSGCSVQTTGTALSGSDVQAKIFNFFVGNGLSPAQTAGIMGNMQAESGFRPAAEQTEGAWNNLTTDPNHAVGLVQWDGGRRVAVINYLKDKGMAPNGVGVEPDAYLGAQLDHVWEELSGPYHDSTLVPLQAATSAADATLIFHQHYEVSADDASRIQGRITNAQTILDTYGGGVTTSASITGASTGCTGGIVAGNIVKTVLGLAWPDNNNHLGTDSATDAYKAAWNGASDMTDCGAFVATVMQKSGVDPGYPSAGTGSQKAYVLGNPKYQTYTDVKDSSGLQPGDILVYGENGAGHTMIYVGPQTGGYLVADASWHDHTPELNTAGDLAWMFAQSGVVVARVK
jgi:hypothetical protein